METFEQKRDREAREARGEYGYETPAQREERERVARGEQPHLNTETAAQRDERLRSTRSDPQRPTQRMDQLRDQCRQQPTIPADEPHAAWDLVRELDQRTGETLPVAQMVPIAALLHIIATHFARITPSQA